MREEILLEGLGKKECECGGHPAIAASTDHFNEPLRRYRIPKHTTCGGCSLGEGMLEDGIHLLIRSLSKSAGSAVRTEFFRAKGILEGKCQCFARRYFKKRTGILKMGGRYIHNHWRTLCYWEVLYGYTRPLGIENLEDEVDEWLVNIRRLGGPMSEADYVSMMINNFYKDWSTEWRRPQDIPTLSEWLKTGKWMRGKSGTGITTTVQIDEKTKRTRRIKGIDATTLTDNDLLSRLVTTTTESFHVMEKSEAGKSRPVVKTGNELFRKMDYLSEWVEKGMYNSLTSTLYTTGDMIKEVDDIIMRAVDDPNLYKVPMDQSNFDWHQSKLSIIGIMFAIGLHIYENDAPQDIKTVWAATWDSLLSRKVPVHMGKKTKTWLNGLPSGLRWTALLDTELNKSSFNTSVEIVEKILAHYIPIKAHVSQGDDINFATTTLQNVRWILHVYNTLGYEAHPEKTFISRERTEFLRKSYESGLGITGYVPRTLLSIRFKNPILENPVVKAARLYSRATTWHLLTLRGGEGKNIGQLYLEDAEQIGVRKEYAAGFLLCPAAFGGAGLDWASEMAIVPKHHFKGYYVPLITQDKRKVIPNLGRWRDRIHQWKDHLEQDNLQKFYAMLAQSWGISEKDLTAKNSLEWVLIRQRAIRPNPNTPPIPEAGDMWNVEHIPVMIMPMVKEGAIRNGTWKELVKKEYWDTIERFGRRVSKNVFEAYMLGYLTVSWPIVDNISMRYGNAIKRRYEKKISQHVNQKNMSIALMKGYIAYFEEEIVKELRRFRGGLLLSV